MRGFVEEYRGCSTCGYVDPASRKRPKWDDIDLRWGCGIVVAIFVIVLGSMCVLSLTG